MKNCGRRQKYIYVELNVNAKWATTIRTIYENKKKNQQEKHNLKTYTK